MKHLRRLGRALWEAQWPLLGLVGLAAVILGFVGFKRHFDALGETPSVWDVLYRDLQLFVLNWGGGPAPVPWELQVARFLAPAVAAAAAVGALLAIFHEEIEMLRIRRMVGHVIVCGLGRNGLPLVRSLRQRGHRVVVMERDSTNEYVRVCRDIGAPVLIGDARDRELLQKVGLQRARHLIAVCGTDGVNAEVAIQARALVKESGGRALNCLAQIYDPRLCVLLRMAELAAPGQGSFMLDFFNVVEGGARALLQDYPPFAETTESGAPAHMVIVGLGELGERILVQAAREWKASHAEGKGRFRATVVDEEAEAKVQSLCQRYAQLTQVCELVPRQMPIDSLAFEQSEFLMDGHGNCDVSAVYVCLDDDAPGLCSALVLNQRLKGRGVPVVVSVARAGGLASLLEGEEGAAAGFEDIHAFGLLDRTLSADLLLGNAYEILARAIHEEYVRQQEAQGHTPETKPAMVPWEDLRKDFKESSRRQARHIGVKLRAAGCSIVPLTEWEAESFRFTDREVERLAAMEHDRWMEENRREGWIYAPERDDKSKRSTYMVPWNELPDDVKDWDRGFIRGLPRFLAGVGFQIIRLGQRQEGEAERTD